MKRFVLGLVLGLAVAAFPIRGPTPIALPPIPATAPTMLGPIPIRVVANLTCNNEPALGCFSGDERYLAIRDSVPLVVMWQATYHELAHAMFYYSNVRFGKPEIEDRLADLIANQRVMELLGGWPR